MTNTKLLTQKQDDGRGLCQYSSIYYIREHVWQDAKLLKAISFQDTLHLYPSFVSGARQVSAEYLLNNVFLGVTIMDSTSVLDRSFK